jgi:hypothetical protein
VLQATLLFSVTENIQRTIGGSFSATVANYSIGFGNTTDSYRRWVPVTLPRLCPSARYLVHLILHYLTRTSPSPDLRNSESYLGPSTSSLSTMDLQFDLLWLSSTAAKGVVASIVLFPMLWALLIPAGAYNKNNIARVEKSWIRVWLEWDRPPRLALDRYIAQGYSKVLHLFLGNARSLGFDDEYSLSKQWGSPLRSQCVGWKPLYYPPSICAS